MDLIFAAKKFKARYEKNYEAIDKVIDFLLTSIVSSKESMAYHEIETAKKDEESERRTASSLDKMNSIEIPRSQYKEHSFIHSESSVSQVIGSSEFNQHEANFMNIHSYIKEPANSVESIVSEVIAERVVPQHVLPQEAGNTLALNCESIPEGSRVITVIVEAGKIVEEIYLTPDGEKLSFKQKYIGEERHLAIA